MYVFVTQFQIFDQVQVNGDTLLFAYENGRPLQLKALVQFNQIMDGLVYDFKILLFNQPSAELAASVHQILVHGPGLQSFTFVGATELSPLQEVGSGDYEIVDFGG